MTGNDLIKIVVENNLGDVHLSDSEDIRFDLEEHRTAKKDRWGDDIMIYVDFVIDTHTGETRLETWDSDN